MQARRHVDPGIGAALLSAALFGASTPLAKLLIDAVHPVMLAALLYLGAGIGLLGGSVLRRMTLSAPRREATLTLTDLPWLGGSLLCGGVLAPVLLMTGLSVTPAASASLLLNLEAMFTALLAWLVFREHVSARIAAGMGLMVAGGLVLSWQGSSGHGGHWGPLAIIGACLTWGIDNNLARRVSGKDPMQVAGAKDLTAGLVNLGLALAIELPWPRPLAAFGAGALGLVSYGMSLVLFMLALRQLGTGRTSAYFASAPFIGTALAFSALHERPSAGFWGAAGLMAAGLWLHLSERHSHLHSHERLAHDHRHVHDAHHQHGHDPRWESHAPHAHLHVHEPLLHSHPHYPDIHHRHDHG
jgi:drug/metabolite transporter (DMT)-like permease